MRITEVAKLFAGSCIVYVVVAACSAYGGDEPSSNGGPPTNPTGDGSNVDSTILDPVPNALAEGHKSGSRLKLRFHEGSDGSRQFINFFDTQYQTPCTINEGTRMTDDKVRCLPAAAGTLLFSNDTCTTVAAYVVSKLAAETPKVAGSDFIFQSRFVREFYTLGALQNAPAGPVYTRGIGGGGGGGCSTSTAYTPTDYNFYSVGAPLAPDSFVEMTIKTE